MLLTDRVQENLHICGLELDFSAHAMASGNFNAQSFYNTDLTNGSFNPVYSSVGSVGFQEQSNEGASGVSYTQTITMKFPSMDGNRSQRISDLQKLKFVSLKLNGGLKLLVGRNDYYQNIAPSVSVSSNTKVTQVQVVTQSIFPIGFFGNTAMYGFPYQLPISFLENI